MRFLLFLVLVGCAAAYASDAWERTLEAQVNDLFGDDAFIRAYRSDDDNDIKTELGKKLRETLNHLLEKMKEAVDHGKTVGEDMIQKFKEVREKMKEVKVGIGEKAKELLQKIKDKANDFIKNLLDRLGLKDSKDAQRRALIFERAVAELVRRAEDDEDIKTEVGNSLREAMLKLLKGIKDAKDLGKRISRDQIDHLEKIIDNLKKLKTNIGEKDKELINKIKDKATGLLRDLLDNFGFKDKRSVAHAEGKILGLFKKLKKAILDTIDKEKLKEKIESLFGKGNELADQLLNMLKEKGDKGKQKLLDLVDRILGEDEARETRSIGDLWEKVKNYFKDLKIDLQEKYLKFGEWVKEKVKKGIDSSKTKLENIKAIAKEFVENSKGVGKDIAVEAMEFLKPYKEDLGTLWDQVKVTVRDVLNKKD